MKVVNIIIIVHNMHATPITIMSVHKQYIGCTYAYTKYLPTTEDDEFFDISNQNNNTN